MNISKDVYEYLTQYADNRTILNMLSVNREFRDDSFFAKVIRRKYPELIIFKREHQTWKSFFLELVHDLESIKESGATYYFTPLQSPMQMIDRIQTNGAICSSLLNASLAGNLERVKELTNQYAFSDQMEHSSILKAIFGKQINVLKYLMDKYNGKGDDFLMTAVEHGDLDMVKYLASKNSSPIVVKFALEDAKALVDDGQLEKQPIVEYLESLS